MSAKVNAHRNLRIALALPRNSTQVVSPRAQPEIADGTAQTLAASLDLGRHI